MILKSKLKEKNWHNLKKYISCTKNWPVTSCVRKIKLPSSLLPSLFILHCFLFGAINLLLQNRSLSVLHLYLIFLSFGFYEGLSFVSPINFDKPICATLHIFHLILWIKFSSFIASQTTIWKLKPCKKTGNVISFKNCLLTFYGGISFPDLEEETNRLLAEHEDAVN